MNHLEGYGCEARGIIVLNIKAASGMNGSAGLSFLLDPWSVTQSWVAVVLAKGFTIKVYVSSAALPMESKVEHKAEKQEPSPKAFLFCSLRYTQQVIVRTLVSLIRSGFIQKCKCRQHLLNFKLKVRATARPSESPGTHSSVKINAVSLNAHSITSATGLSSVTPCTRPCTAALQL